MIALGLLQRAQRKDQLKATLLWRTEFVQIDKLLQTLETRPPQQISPLGWKMGVDRLRAGYWNACFSEARVSISQLKVLRRQLACIAHHAPNEKASACV